MGRALHALTMLFSTSECARPNPGDMSTLAPAEFAEVVIRIYSKFPEYVRSLWYTNAGAHFQFTVNTSATSKQRSAQSSTKLGHLRMTHCPPSQEAPGHHAGTTAQPVPVLSRLAKIHLLALAVPLSPRIVSRLFRRPTSLLRHHPYRPLRKEGEMLAGTVPMTPLLRRSGALAIRWFVLEGRFDG